MVSSSYASVEPGTVVVKPVDASVADIAMSATRQNDDLALWTQFC